MQLKRGYFDPYLQILTNLRALEGVFFSLPRKNKASTFIVKDCSTFSLHIMVFYLYDNLLSKTGGAAHTHQILLCSHPKYKLFQADPQHLDMKFQERQYSGLD
jgi:hypothetical protein